MNAHRPPGPGHIDIGTLADMLADRIDALCCDLLPQGHQEGHEYVDARRAEGGLGDSMRVHLTGGKAGVWCHFATGRKGDALDLVSYVMFGDDKKTAVRWSKAWLGLDNVDPDAFTVRRRKAEARKAERQRTAAETAERNRGRAWQRFLEAKRELRGTPVDRYLQGRGIFLEALGRQPGSIRFHPSLFCSEVQRPLPAMVAAVAGPPEGKLIAIHRTYLALHPDGRVTKADLEEPKKTLGEFKGGSIRLWRGASGKPLSQALPGEDLGITEGIEDALTMAQACPNMRMLCAVSLDNMANLVLPAQLGRVYIIADNDGNNLAAAAGLDKATQNFLRQGFRTLHARPPAGVKDVNELLKQEARA